MLVDFVYENFVGPICNQTVYAPYNAVNTAAYAAIVIAAAFLIYRSIRKMKVGIDSDFFLAVSSFVLFGGLFRVLEDAFVSPATRCTSAMPFEIVFWLVSPGIYFFVFFAFVACAWLSRAIASGLKKDWKHLLFWLGIVLSELTALVLIVFVPKIDNPLLGLFIFSLAAVSWLVFLFLAGSSGGGKPVSFEESSAFFSHALDGAATFVGTSFAGYSEQHVVGNFIIDATGSSFWFFAVKLLFAGLVVFIARKELSKPSEQEEKTFFLLLITVFGLAPGVRDLTRIVFGV